jgi:hypothetical protein
MWLNKWQSELQFSDDPMSPQSTTIMKLVFYAGMIVNASVLQF